jgi:hypothetical protein
MAFPSSVNMQDIIMIYGSHGNSDFLKLKPILDKEISKLKKKNPKIISMIEYNGPLNTIFRIYEKNFRDLDKKLLFDKSTNDQLEAFKFFMNTGKTIFSKRDGKIIIKLEMTSIFLQQLINYFQSANVNILFQIPEYTNWEKIRPFIKDYSPKLSEYQRTFFYLKNLSETEKTFREQVRREMQEHNKSSFLIIRGLFHFLYYPYFRKEFSNFYSIRVKTYFKSSQILKDIFFV